MRPFFPKLPFARSNALLHLRLSAALNTEDASLSLGTLCLSLSFFKFLEIHHILIFLLSLVTPLILYVLSACLPDLYIFLMLHASSLNSTYSFVIILDLRF